MKLLIKTREHLGSQNETYFKHMWGAWKIVYLLNTLAFKCFIHSLFPFLYTGAVSERIDCLEKMTKRASTTTPPHDELYKIYGGD